MLRFQEPRGYYPLVHGLRVRNRALISLVQEQVIGHRVPLYDAEERVNRVYISCEKLSGHLWHEEHLIMAPNSHNCQGLLDRDHFHCIHMTVGMIRPPSMAGLEAIIPRTLTSHISLLPGINVLMCQKECLGWNLERQIRERVPHNSRQLFQKPKARWLANRLWHHFPAQAVSRGSE